MKANQVIEKIRSEIGASGDEVQYEGFCAGDPDIEIQGIAVCQTPNVSVLRDVIKTNNNLIISREHPFYSHGTWYADGTADVIENDLVATAKRKLIEDNQLVVYRLSSAWDRTHPKAQSTGLAEALGWQPGTSESDDSSQHVICDTPSLSLRELAERAKSRLNVVTRIVGDPDLKISRVAVLTGLSDVPAMAKAIEDKNVNGVIAGEANEWQAAPYFKDAVDAGRSIGLVYVGFAASDGPAMKTMAQWIRDTVGNDVPVEVASADMPYAYSK